MAKGVVGIYPEERGRKQDILVSLWIYADLSKACVSDKIHDTIDYQEIEMKVLDLVAGAKCFLIERLAQQIAEKLLSFTDVLKVKVRVGKPAALQSTGMAEVTIVRKKTV